MKLTTRKTGRAIEAHKNCSASWSQKTKPFPFQDDDGDSPSFILSTWWHVTLAPQKNQSARTTIKLSSLHIVSTTQKGLVINPKFNLLICNWRCYWSFSVLLISRFHYGELTSVVWAKSDYENGNWQSSPYWIFNAAVFLDTIIILVHTEMTKVLDIVNLLSLQLVTSTINCRS